MSYQDLIARLEKATGPDRELDRAIADLIFDLEWKPYGPRARKLWGYKRGTDHVEIYDERSVKPYTASIDAALTLVPEGWTRAVDATAPECRIDVDLFAPGTGPRVRGSHESEPIALCIAALKARQSLTSAQGE